MKSYQVHVTMHLEFAPINVGDCSDFRCFWDADLIILQKYRKTLKVFLTYSYIFTKSIHFLWEKFRVNRNIERFGMFGFFIFIKINYIFYKFLHNFSVTLVNGYSH